MKHLREIHDDLLYRLNFYDRSLADEFIELRNYILSIYPESNELLYDTHALTTVFTPTLKLGDAFCHIPIYSKHFNLGFNKGTLIDDPNQLLRGTGKLIRHIPIKTKEDYSNKNVRELIQAAIAFSLEDVELDSDTVGQTISKIKK